MTEISQTQLPEAVTQFFARRRGSDAGLDTIFTPDAHVVDDGETYNGLVEIAEWIEGAETTYRYTTTFQRADREGVEVTVRNRLEGDFPGGVVDLRYVFQLRDGLIEDLVIAP